MSKNVFVLGYIVINCTIVTITDYELQQLVRWTTIEAEVLK